MGSELNSVAKPGMEYAVFRGRNPVEGGVLLLPRIVNKGVYDSSRLVKYAMTNGYVQGGQYYANYGIFNGCLEAMRRLLMDGNDIKLDNWFRAHLELTGKVDQETKQLTPENKLHLCFQTLADFRCNVSDYSWTCVEDSGPQPKVQHLQSAGGKNDREIFANAKISVGGTNLAYSAATDKVSAEWYETGESGESVRKSCEFVPETSGYSMQILPWNAALATAPVGTEVTFTFLLHNGSAEGTVIPAIRSATVVANG